MKRIFLIFTGCGLLLVMWMIFSGVKRVFNDNPAPALVQPDEEKSLRADVMLIYQIGYMEGFFNTNQSRLNFDRKAWGRDSAKMIDRWNKAVYSNSINPGK